MFDVLTLRDDHDDLGRRQRITATVNAVGGLRLRSRTVDEGGVHEWVLDHTTAQTEEVTMLLGGDEGVGILDVLRARQAQDALPTSLHAWLAEQGVEGMLGTSRG